MPTYVIERTIPGAGSLTPAERKEISLKSCCVLQDMGPQYTWHHSYVTEDKFFCIHSAPDEETIREHSKKGGFPVDRVMEVRSVIDPATAEAT